MSSFLEPGTLLKMSFFVGIFQGFYLKVSADFFHLLVNLFVHGLFKIIQNYVNNKISN